VLNRLAADELDVELMSYRDFARYMVDVGYRQISVEEIDPAFTVPYLNTDHEAIKASVFALKKSVQKALMEIDGEIEPLRRILEETNPNEILGLCHDVKYHTNSYGKMGVDVSDIINNADLASGLQQYKERRELLDRLGQSDLYVTLMEDMHEQIRPALMLFWEKHSRKDRNWWLGYSVCLSLQDKAVVRSSTYERAQEPRILSEDSHLPDRETSKGFVDRDGAMHVEYAVNWYGLFNEEGLSLEEKVEQFMWQYEKLLAETFFALLIPEEPQKRN
jgi:hypothetical protein